MLPSALLLSTLLLSASGLASGAAPPAEIRPRFCDVPQTVDFRDLPGIMANTPGALNPPVQNPYHGLDYGAGWGVGRKSSGETRIVILLQTSVRGPTDIAVDKPSGYKSFALRSFDWYGTIDAQQPTVIAAANTTLVLDGTTETGAAVQARCEYDTTLVGGVTVGQLPNPTKCTLPSSFRRVTYVKFSIGSALAGVRGAAVLDVNYVLYRC